MTCIPRTLRTVLLVLAATACMSDLAHAQGFMARPLSFDLTPPPGATIQDAVEVRNTTGDPLDLQISAVMVGQDTMGSWIVVKDTDKEAEQAKKISCVDWISLKTQALKVDPQQSQTVPFTLRVPPGSRGFRAAALVVENKPVRKGNFVMVIRFLLPIRVTIQGAPARQQINSTDLQLRYISPEDKSAKPVGVKPPTTAALVTIENTGETYGKLGGNILVLRKEGNRWRRASDVPLGDRGIIPGATITPFMDLKKRYPSGHYRISANLTCNGRALRPLDREFDFEGDPGVTTVHGDVKLQLPPILEADAAPGTTRSANVTLENPSEDEVDVQIKPINAPELAGVMIGDLTGDELSCAQWLEVRPDTVRLRPGASRNLRLMVRFPEAEKPQANYYARLALKATYTDGQDAGEFTGLVWVHNTKGVDVLKAEPVKLVIAQQDKDQYLATAVFANVGNLHFDAPCMVRVLSPTGGEQFVEEQAEGKKGIVLPMGMPEFSAQLDFSKVPAGVYSLVASLGGEKAPVSGALPIRVEDSPEGKIVTIISTPPPAAAGGEGK
jgi:hypothetical protein